MKRIVKFSTGAKSAEQIKYAKIVSAILVVVVLLLALAVALVIYLGWQAYAV